MVKRVGVIGGGQLAWMMAEAATRLGVELVIQTPSASDPAVAIASDTILAAVDDAAATAQLATRCDVITFENEFVDLEALLQLEAQGVCFRPSLKALEPLLDKYHQRCYLRDLGLPTPRFTHLDPEQASQEPANKESREEELNRSLRPGCEFPIVLKTRRHGYDGQGTFIVKDAAMWEATLAASHHPLLLEEFVPFERELAVIAARSTDGTVVTYPVVETQQQDQVCRRVIVPANVDSAVVAEVEAIARKLLGSLEVVGVFGIELFLTAAGNVLVNEIAPRTHNSGHFTLDACDTSQFEQQLRAVCGLPLGSPALRSHGAVMVNLLGYEASTSDYLAKRQRLAAIPEAHVYWYGKAESRPGRKLGHVTVLLSQPLEQGTAIIEEIESIWYGA